MTVCELVCPEASPVFTKSLCFYITAHVVGSRPIRCFFSSGNIFPLFHIRAQQMWPSRLFVCLLTQTNVNFVARFGCYAFLSSTKMHLKQNKKSQEEEEMCTFCMILSPFRWEVACFVKRSRASFMCSDLKLHCQLLLKSHTSGVTSGVYSVRYRLVTCTTIISAERSGNRNKKRAWKEAK